MDLTFQVPIQYCSLQHWILLSSPDTSTAECHIHFGPPTSFILGRWVVLLCSSPVQYLTPSDPGCSSSSVIAICLSILYMGFLRQEYWSSLPFPPPVDHILSELFTMTYLSWVALHSQGSRPSPWKTNAKKQKVCLRRTYK